MLDFLFYGLYTAARDWSYTQSRYYLLLFV